MPQLEKKKLHRLHQFKIKTRRVTWEFAPNSGKELRIQDFLSPYSKYVREFLEGTRRVTRKMQKSVLEMSFCVVWLAFKGSDHFNTVGIKLFCQ